MTSPIAGNAVFSMRMQTPSAPHAAELPDPWKYSLVHPIFKSGDATDPSNFRPISIVPVITKVVERVVQRQLQHYLSHNHLLSTSQHGFRPRHSTETALVSVSDRILDATDKGEVSLLCLIDLSKAFDVINHDILIRKLQLHGIETSWFSAYLRGHTQSVSLRDGSGRGVTSLPLPNNMGVFQGSVLGPLLFTAFSNDLAFFSKSAEIFQYADDTQVLVSGKKADLGGLISRLEESLASLSRWFRGNTFKVNANKTQLIAFGSSQNLRNLPNFSVTFLDATLTPCAEVKNLGVTFDRVMSWDAHVSQLSQRCIGILTGLTHVRHSIPSPIISTLVTALVLSHVRYCISVFGNGTKKNMDKIQKIINFAARVIFGRRKFDPTSHLLEALGWLTAQQMADHSLMTLTHRVLSQGTPTSLASELIFNRDVRERVTRQDGHLHLPKPDNNAGKRRFGYRAPALYNRLPEDIRSLPQSAFARALKTQLRNSDG